MINENIVNKMKNDWFVSNVQVSMDGTYDYYENIKQYGGGANFETVINNIEILLKKKLIQEFEFTFHLKTLINAKNWLYFLKINLSHVRLLQLILVFYLMVRKMQK